MKYASKKPLVGLTANTYPPDKNRSIYAGKYIQAIETEAVRIISRAGGLPVMLPNTACDEDIKQMIETIDGLILSGGSDVAPESYGEKPISNKWPGDKERDEYEIKLLDLALKNQKPVLGLCRGIQIMNVYFGGTLYQDIETQKKNSIQHRDPEQYDKLAHSVTLQKESHLFSLYKKEKLLVNSVHHQAIKDLGKGLAATAFSEDGMIEAIEPTDKNQFKFLLAIQWHPEWANENHPKIASGIKLIAAFLDAC